MGMKMECVRELKMRCIVGGAEVERIRVRVDWVEVEVQVVEEWKR